MKKLILIITVLISVISNAILGLINSPYRFPVIPIVSSDRGVRRPVKAGENSLSPVKYAE